MKTKYIINQKYTYMKRATVEIKYENVFGKQFDLKEHAQISDQNIELYLFLVKYFSILNSSAFKSWQREHIRSMDDPFYKVRGNWEQDPMFPILVERKQIIINNKIEYFQNAMITIKRDFEIFEHLLLYSEKLKAATFNKIYSMDLPAQHYAAKLSTMFN